MASRPPPPPRTSHVRPSPVVPLPIAPSPPSAAPTRPLSSLVGREREIAALRALLSRDDVRLLTLTGPGGVGKTRLALRVAESLAADFPAGVAFVPLAAVADPDLLLPTIARALGLRERRGLPAADLLVAHLAAKRLLLLLDNVEQLAAAAPSLTALLGACPSLVIVATSRQPLHLSGEQRFSVPPLSLDAPTPSPFPIGDHATGPDPHPAPAPAEAVRLFVERAREMNIAVPLDPATADLVAAICRRLDGLPLAIELAAARLRHLSLPSLLAHLDQRLPLLTGGPLDAPARHRTMRDAIAWSHDLLPPAEQTGFRRLAVFAGGFTLDAAEAVADDDPSTPTPHTEIAPTAADRPASPPASLDLVASLVDKSLLRADEDPGGDTRYHMLETIREFGLHQLATAGEATETHRRHARWSMALAEAVGPQVRGWDQAAAIARLDAEHGNLRAALAWLLDHGAAADALRLAAALHLFWFTRGYAGEGLAWLERALAAAASTPQPARARALLAAGHLAHHRADDDRATAHLAACLACYRALDDRPGQALPLHMLGMMAEDRGDYHRAARQLAAARVLFVEADNLPYAANALYHLGIVAYGQGDLREATERQLSALAEARAAGDAYTAAAALGYLALAQCDRGELIAALAAVTESLAIYQSAHDLIGLARGLAHVAVIAHVAGEHDSAARLFGAFDALTEPVGYGFAHPEIDRYQQTRLALQADLGVAAFAAALIAGRALGLEAALTAAAATGQALAARCRADAPPPAQPPAALGLTPREAEILRLLAAGHANRAIADRLFISPATVARHLANLYPKLAVSSRAEATTFALRHGLA